MSRVGKRKISILDGVTVKVENSIITVTGPKGTLTHNLPKGIKLDIEGNEITVDREKETKILRELHGTTNAVLNNLIIGVKDGFSKTLIIKGVGYRFAVEGNILVINAGYSNPRKLEIPAGLTAEMGKAVTEVTISGIDKVKVGEFAANVRKQREPEVYKGKGIRYSDEKVVTKERATSK